MIELELYILFICALGFTFLFELYYRRGDNPEVEEGSRMGTAILGIFATFCWVVMSLVYFIGAGQEGRPYMVALFFFGIGIIYMLRLGIAVLRKWEKELEQL